MKKAIKLFVLIGLVVAWGCDTTKDLSSNTPGLADASKTFLKAYQSGKSLPALTKVMPSVSLSDGYALQKLWVKDAFSQGGIGGIKGGVVTTAAQETFGVKEPIAGVLPASGKQMHGDNVVLKISDCPGFVIETEIGFVISKRIDKKLTSVEQFLDHVEGVCPIIELPCGDWDKPEGTPAAADFAAVNLTAAGYIVGPTSSYGDEITYNFYKDGVQLHDAYGKDNWKGPAETGLWLSQFALMQEIALKPGMVIICGALGKIHPAKVGDYVLDAGTLGKIEFSIAE